MKLGDLRLGNWVKIDVGVGQVSCLMSIEFEDWAIGEDMPICVDGEAYNYPRSCTAEEVEGIPLTEEILINCGFEYIDEENKKEGLIYDINGYRVYISYWENRWRIPIGAWYAKYIRYVHELQNMVYFAFDKELEVTL